MRDAAGSFVGPRSGGFGAKIAEARVLLGWQITKAKALLGSLTPPKIVPVRLPDITIYVSIP
jgi:hypothetical protein